MKRQTGYNGRFAKAGGSCFYESEVLNSSFVHLMKFSAKNPRPSGSCKTLVVIIGPRLEKEYISWNTRTIIYTYKNFNR